LDETSGLYQIREGAGARRIGRYAHVPQEVLDANPEALVTGVYLDGLGRFTLGKRKGAWFNLRNHPGEQNLVLQLREGVPFELFKPVYEGTVLKGYERLHRSHLVTFWSGKIMRQEAGSKYYQLADDGEPRKLLTVGRWPTSTG
jgi:hypothetical protein